MSEKQELTVKGLEEERVFLPPISGGASHALSAESFLPMVQGTATNKFRVTATKNLVIDRNGNAIIEEEGFKAFFRGYSTLKGGLTVGAKKMLDLGALALTAQNHFRAKQGQSIDTAVSISLEEYGLKRGYDLTPRKTSTKEEEEAEKKRLTGVMHNIRKRVNAELELLFSLSLSWTEPGKKRPDYSDIRILQSKGIRNGYINMRFSDDIATYLTHAYIMQYPIALQAIDERNPRTYNIGYKLALHHSNDNNRLKGTNDIISVKSLLEASGDIPTFEEVKEKDRGHWEERIKNALEAALDSATKSGIILSWEYCNSKKIPLSDEQITISDYQTFSGLYIHFEMTDGPDKSERLQRKQEQKEAAKEAAKKRKPRRKKTSKKETEGGE